MFNSVVWVLIFGFARPYCTSAACCATRRLRAANACAALLCRCSRSLTGTERWCACARGSSVHSTQTSVRQSRHSDCTASCGCAAHATGAARIDWSAAAAADEDEDDEDEDEEAEEADGDESESAEDEAVGESGCAESRVDAERWRPRCGSVGGDDDALRCVAVGDFGPPLELDSGVDGTIATLMLPVLAAALDPGADDPTPTNDALPMPALLWLRLSIDPGPPMAD